MTKGFLTDQLRRVVEGETAEDMDIAETTYRDYRLRAEDRAAEAMTDLIRVAHSPVIDNSEVFDPEQIRVLITTLIIGAGGLVDDEAPAMVQAWEPDEEYAREVYVAADRALHGYRPQGLNSKPDSSQ